MDVAEACGAAAVALKEDGDAGEHALWRVGMGADAVDERHGGAAAIDAGERERRECLSKERIFRGVIETIAIPVEFRGGLRVRGGRGGL